MLREFWKRITAVSTPFGGLSWGHLRFDPHLYDRQWQVVDGVDRFICDVLRDCCPEPAHFVTFNRDTREARFLFGREAGKKVVRFLGELRARAAEIRCLSLKIGDPCRYGHPERLTWCEREAKIANWFEDELKELDVRFAPYMEGA